MNERSTSKIAALTLAATSLLCACASTAPEYQPTSLTPSLTPSEEKTYILGSRIPAKSTEKLVREIGSASAQEMQRNRPPGGGMPAN